MYLHVFCFSFCGRITNCQQNDINRSTITIWWHRSWDGLFHLKWDFSFVSIEQNRIESISNYDDGTWNFANATLYIDRFFVVINFQQWSEYHFSSWWIRWKSFFWASWPIVDEKKNSSLRLRFPCNAQIQLKIKLKFGNYFSAHLILYRPKYPLN